MRHAIGNACWGKLQRTIYWDSVTAFRVMRHFSEETLREVYNRERSVRPTIGNAPEGTLCEAYNRERSARLTIGNAV